MTRNSLTPSTPRRWIPAWLGVALLALASRGYAQTASAPTSAPAATMTIVAGPVRASTSAATTTATAPATAPAATAAPAPATAPAPFAPSTTRVSSTKPFVPMTAPAPKPNVHKAPAPTTAADPKTCTTADCHPEIKDYKAIHGPVNVNACDACHTLTDPAKHTYELARPREQICTFCHKMDSISGLGGGAGVALPVVHQPVQTGNCLPCHNPHGGKTTKLIRGDGAASMLAVCNQCHLDVVGKKANVHGPVAAGACEACHSPHASKFPKLLREESKGLCLSCHKEMADQLKSAKVTHKPVLEGECVQCHDPHASDFKMQVKAAPLALCTSCHEHDKIKQAATDAKYKHTIVTEDQACLNCHTPHGGPLAKLLKARPVDVCIKCHKTEQKAPDGHVVKSVAEVMNPALTRHGPVKDGLCTGCHSVHGSDVQKLLAKPYPETFYAKFDPDNFALCFTCHDKKLVEAKEAGGLTGFRNGTLNLHYVHVNKEKGRTCRACHEVHASPSPVLLRISVPYGQWDLPLNYNKTDTGGSCAPGCHKQYAYDRNVPVDNGTGTATGTAPATFPEPGATQPGAPGATTPDTVPASAPATKPASVPGVLNLPH